MDKPWNLGGSSFAICCWLATVLLVGCGSKRVEGPMSFSQTAQPAITRWQEVKFVRYLLNVLDLKAPAQNWGSPVPSDNPLRTKVDAIALMLEIGAHKPDVIQDAADEYHRFDVDGGMDDTLRTLYCLLVDAGEDHLRPLGIEEGELSIVGTWPRFRTGWWPDYFQDERVNGMTYFEHEGATGRLRDLRPYAKQRMTDAERGELWRRFSNPGPSLPVAAPGIPIGIVRLTPEFVKKQQEEYYRTNPVASSFHSSAPASKLPKDNWRLVPLHELGAWVSLSRSGPPFDGVDMTIQYGEPVSGLVYPEVLRVRDAISNAVLWAEPVATDKVRKASGSSVWRTTYFSSPESRALVLELSYRGKRCRSLPFHILATD